MSVRFDDLNPLRSWDTKGIVTPVKFRDFRETGPCSWSRSRWLNSSPRAVHPKKVTPSSYFFPSWPHSRPSCGRSFNERNDIWNESYVDLRTIFYWIIRFFMVVKTLYDPQSQIRFWILQKKKHGPYCSFWLKIPTGVEIIFKRSIIRVPWSQRFFWSREREKRKTSGYLGLESHFHAVARVRIWPSGSDWLICSKTRKSIWLVRFVGNTVGTRDC